MTAYAKPVCPKDERSPISRRQFVEQRLCLFKIERVEAFGEPAVDRSEKLASLIPLALIAPDPGKAGGGAKLEHLGALTLLLSRWPVGS